MSISSPPIFTDTVDQNFFIEAQGGAQQPVSYLDRFPSSVYTKAIDSVLVTFAYALLGPAGVGYLRESYLNARLQVEDAGLNSSDLDDLYTSPFAFARAALETYSTDASAALLPSQERAQILAADASFRNRAITYFKAIRAGGTLQGLSLAAQSGLDHPVDLVENYRALYDSYSDMPLGLPFMGTTTNLNEVVILPRRDVPTNAQQTISISGEPTSGWFTLSLPIGPNYQPITVQTTSGSPIVTVPNSAQTPPGAYLSINSGSFGWAYVVVNAIVSPTSVSVVWAPQESNAGQTANIGFASGTYQGYVGNAQTVPLPYNATYAQIQSALWGLPLVGNNDVSVSGGPLPDQPVTITFSGRLADQPIPALQFNLAPDTVAGIGSPNAAAPLGSQLIDTTNNPLNIAGSVTVDQVGVSADSQSAYISPANEHAMEIALDILRPQTSFFTTVEAEGTTRRQPAKVFAGQVYTEVLRFATGQAGVNWPPVDATHWIQNGVEVEAPRPVGNLTHHYQGFHNITNVIAYTEAALHDSGYASGLTPIGVTYWDSKIGSFSQAQTALYPMLSRFNDTTAQHGPNQVVATSPDPLVITKNINGSGVINDIYPADYLSLPGVPQLPTSQLFWASAERTPPQSGSSVDYLEIDLGTAQAVNYLYFEATNKPYTIDVAYDTLDQSPARAFAPVTIMDPHVAPSTTSLYYFASITNPWTTVEIHFTNAMNQMIYARYLRIGFTRNPVESPFAPANGPYVPYSIEVRNLRVGRNLASDMDRRISMNRSAGVTSRAHIYPSPALYPSSTTFPA